MSDEAGASAGERAFLQRWSERLPRPPTGEVWMGDDAAVLAGGLVFATDGMVEGVHFDLAWCTATDVGWKALAVNLSDVAAMGGEPRAAVVTLVVPSDRAGLADEVMTGIADAAARLGCPLVGGDTTTGPQLMVSVAVIGAVGATGAVLRAGARAGDVVFATGPLGGAASALRALRAGDECDQDAIDRLRRPVPRLLEGRAAAAGGATAMIDLSDGLGVDLGHLCDASDVGVRVDAALVPLAPGATLLEAFAGDDYELCFTAPDPARVVDHFLASGCPTPVRIGTITTGHRLLIDEDGVEQAFPINGWEHRVR